MARHRLVIIGGDAGGLSAAAQARRLRSAEELDIGVHRLADGADIRAAVAAGAERAVVLGGGYIGLEMAEVLQTRGLSVTVVLADPLPMAQLDTDMAERVCKAMWDMGIEVQTDQPVREIEVDADG